MCIMSTPKPQPVPEVPAAPQTLKTVDANMQTARTDELKRQRAAAGRGGAIVASTDLTQPATTQRTLLG